MFCICLFLFVSVPFLFVLFLSFFVNFIFLHMFCQIGCCTYGVRSSRFFRGSSVHIVYILYTRKALASLHATRGACVADPRFFWDLAIPGILAVPMYSVVKWPNLPLKSIFCPVFKLCWRLEKVCNPSRLMLRILPQQQCLSHRWEMMTGIRAISLQA